MDLSRQSEDREGLLDASAERDCHNEKHLRPQYRPEKRSRRILVGLLSLSALANIVLSVILLRSLPAESRSKYAKLERSREEPYVRLTHYNSDNETLQNQLWRDINVDYGVVALSDEWAAKHGLRKAQRFPWDHTKGIYILHGFHNLHCIKIIHISMAEYRSGAPQSRSWHHVSHCMDALRRQIMCDADDTPRATDRRPEVVSGLLQHRKCRNWDELVEFSKRHTACYKRPDNPSPDGRSSIERYKHCPPGSGYVIKDDYVPPDELLTGLPEESLEGII